MGKRKKSKKKPEVVTGRQAKLCDPDYGEDIGIATCTAKTAKALLCEFDDGRKHWIPRSQVHHDSEVANKGHRGVVIVTKWLAGKLAGEAAADALGENEARARW